MYTYWSEKHGNVINVNALFNSIEFRYLVDVETTTSTHISTSTTWTKSVDVSEQGKSSANRSTIATSAGKSIKQLVSLSKRMRQSLT